MKVRTNALINLWDMWLLYYHFSEIRFHCTHAWNVPALTCRDTWNTCRPASPPSWTPHDLRHVTDTCFSRQVRPSDCQYSQLPHHPHSHLNSIHTSTQYTPPINQMHALRVDHALAVLTPCTTPLTLYQSHSTSQLNTHILHQCCAPSHSASMPWPLAHDISFLCYVVTEVIVHQFLYISSL